MNKLIELLWDSNPRFFLKIFPSGFLHPYQAIFIKILCDIYRGLVGTTVKLFKHYTMVGVRMVNSTELFSPILSKRLEPKRKLMCIKFHWHTFYGLGETVLNELVSQSVSGIWIFILLCCLLNYRKNLRKHLNSHSAREKMLRHTP